MTLEKEVKLGCLLSAGGKLDNLKFFRGTDAEIDEVTFLREVSSSVERSRAPEAQLSRAAPRCRKSPVDLRALVAAM